MMLMNKLILVVMQEYIHGDKERAFSVNDAIGIENTTA